MGFWDRILRGTTPKGSQRVETWAALRDRDQAITGIWISRGAVNLDGDKIKRFLVDLHENGGVRFSVSQLEAIRDDLLHVEPTQYKGRHGTKITFGSTPPIKQAKTRRLPGPGPGAHVATLASLADRDVASLLEVHEDLTESRSWAAFTRIVESHKSEKEGDNDRALKLAVGQIEETPDFDVPYCRAAAIYSRTTRNEEAIAVLRQGLSVARRVSFILDELGERYIDANRPVEACVAFTASIIAQRPQRSDHSAYLNLAGIFAAAGFGNAARELQQISDRISENNYPGGIALTPRRQAQISGAISPATSSLGPIVRHLILLLKSKGAV
jgi:hypothetical protein